MIHTGSVITDSKVLTATASAMSCEFFFSCAATATPITAEGKQTASRAVSFTTGSTGKGVSISRAITGITTSFTADINEHYQHFAENQKHCLPNIP